MSSAFNKFSSAPGAAHYHHDHRQRIPQQQGVGQTLPPMPVGSEPHNTPPPPPGAMSPGTHVVVGRHKVVIQVYLAEGGFAHVYLVRMKEFPDPIVLKRIAVPDTERLKSVEKEIVFMRRLGSHKNIVRYFDSQVSPLPTGGFEALILMEYCPGGGVIDLMNRRLQQRLTEPEILKIFGDVSEALAYMHYCNPPALHRDLKVENILISATGRYKLCDFGSACLSKGTYVPRTLPEIQKLEDDIQRHTTLQYRAPEMIDIYQKRPINEKADIWALGVLLYKLCYYTTPFEDQGPLAILSAKFTFPPYPQFSEQVKNLISWLLSEDQDRRPNIYKVVEAVCKLRGKECPIRNIYANVSATSSPQSHASDSIKSTNDRREPDSIFEQRVQPKQQTPNITPMRRGRPERKGKDSSGTGMSEDNKAKESFDPFDPNSFSSANQKQPVLDFDPAKIFSLNENTAFTSKTESADIDTKKNSARNSMIHSIPSQSGTSQVSTPASELSPMNNAKSGSYQRSISPRPSTPDSFKSPNLDAHVKQLTGDNRLLQAALSGGQPYSPARSPSPLVNHTASPVNTGSDVSRDGVVSSTTSDDILKSAKFPSTPLKPTRQAQFDTDTKTFGYLPNKPRYDSLPKSERSSVDTSMGHSRNYSDPKAIVARTEPPVSNVKNLPATSSSSASASSNNRDSRFAGSKSSFSDLIPDFTTGKEDSVESFNRKFPDLLSLDQQLSGSFESSKNKKSDGSAAFRALEEASKHEHKPIANNTPANRPSVLDRYQPRAETVERDAKRSSVSSHDDNDKGNYIQSKVMQQLHRFELASNDRRTDLQSRRNSTKMSPPSVQTSEGNAAARTQSSSSTRSESPLVATWRRSSSQEGASGSPKLASNDNPSNDLVQMTKSIQNYRQMLQSPSPSPKDDEVKFNFTQTLPAQSPSPVPEKSSSKTSASFQKNVQDESISNSNKTSKENAPTPQNVNVDQAPKADSPSSKTVPATQSGAYRPTPPPKPARFRMSSAMAPVLTPSSAAKGSQIRSKPIDNSTLGQQRPAQWMNREPSISEFESKFPSPEQLQQGLPKEDSNTV